MLDKMLTLFVTIVTFLSSVTGIGGYNTDYEVYTDIRYSDSCVRDILDLYIPDAAYDREENGFILNIHGGSWSGGEKENKAYDCIQAAARGYIAATMSFTLNSGDMAATYSIDKTMDEITLAIAKVKDFCAELGINVTKVALSGYSSGAHQAMLYAYSRADESPVEIAFTANKVGPCDFTEEAWGAAGPGIARSLAGKEIVEQFTAEGREDEIISYVSPVAYMTKDSVPSLFAYGGLDFIVPSGNMKSMIEKAEEEGCVHDFVFFPLNGHGLKINYVTPAYFKYTKLYFEYCEKYFGY